MLAALLLLAAGAPSSPPWLEGARREVAAVADVRRAERFAKAGDGTPTHPWTGWEAAFASVPASGARVLFGPGTYTQTAQVRVPTGLNGWLAVVGGPRVTIKLTAGAPRFLDPDLTADHQVVRHVWIEGFTIDAGHLGGKDHVIFGNYVDGGGIGGWRRVDWDAIVIKDVRAFDLLVDPTMSSHRGGVAILSSQAMPGEAVADTITRIYLEGVRIEGGNWGILVDGGIRTPDGSPNVDIDDVWLVRCWHSLLERQPRFFSSNFQVGEGARVGHVYVIDCYGQYAADTGLELNATASAYVSGTTIEDAAIANFYYVDYNTPRSEPLVVYERCVSRITGGVHAPYGFGWMIKDAHRSTLGGGRFRIVDSRFERSGTAQATETGAGVTAEGRLSELSIARSGFRLAGVDVGAGPASQRVLELDFQNDVTFALHDVTVEARGVRSAPAGGLSAITTQSSAAGKTLTLDWDDVHVSVEVAGPPVDYTIFTSTIYATAASAVRGTIRGYRIDRVDGDRHARGINVDLAHQTVAGSLAISGVDARALPADGTPVQLNNVSDPSQARKVSLRRIRKPTAPIGAAP
ncbi:MAG TPA: hypothetical protein VFV19_14750 [Candidatus Polarisedimenticolaceae bacterium]|nr:hypothetical protein [Candidatus Polarisedimenticolaceae bacterium]